MQNICATLVLWGLGLACIPVAQGIFKGLKMGLHSQP